MALDDLGPEYAIGEFPITPNIPGFRIGDIVPDEIIDTIAYLWVFFIETAPPSISYGAGVTFGCQSILQVSRSLRHIPPSTYDEELKEGGILGFTTGALGGLFGGVSCGADLPHAISGCILGGITGSAIGAYTSGLCKFFRY